MMLTAKQLLSFLLASTAASVVSGAEVTGYLMDKQCLSTCLASDDATGCTPDGSNAFYTPQLHTGWCLLLPKCVESGYMLVSAAADTETGKHAIVANFTDAKSQAAVVAYVARGHGGGGYTGRSAFPLVTVVHPDGDASVASDGEGGGAAVVQVTEAVLQDPWSVAGRHDGGDTTQTLCRDARAADVGKNNLCFRSDVQVSRADGPTGTFVVESSGCPDHANMVDGSGAVVNGNADAEASPGGGAGCGGATSCAGAPCSAGCSAAGGTGCGCSAGCCSAGNASGCASNGGGGACASTNGCGAASCAAGCGSNACSSGAPDGCGSSASTTSCASNTCSAGCASASTTGCASNACSSGAADGCGSSASTTGCASNTCSAGCASASALSCASNACSSGADDGCGSSASTTGCASNACSSVAGGCGSSASTTGCVSNAGSSGAAGGCGSSASTTGCAGVCSSGADDGCGSSASTTSCASNAGSSGAADGCGSSASTTGCASNTTTSCASNTRSSGVQAGCGSGTPATSCASNTCSAGCASCASSTSFASNNCSSEVSDGCGSCASTTSSSNTCSAGVPAGCGSSASNTTCASNTCFAGASGGCGSCASTTSCASNNCSAEVSVGCGSCASATSCASKACGGSDSCCSSESCCAATKCGACGGCAGKGCAGCKDTHIQGLHDPMYQHYIMSIPQVPGTPGKPTVIMDDVVGIMTNGVLLDSHSQTWSYDSCNGHSDTKHQYHYHIPPVCYLQSMGVAAPSSSDWWIDPEKAEVRAYSEMAAQFPATASPSPVVGFARDGFPIYALYDAEGNLQRSMRFGGDLDECNGKEDANGYGYYITAEPPFVPACLRGAVGSFSHATTDIACPRMGITNVIEGVASPGVEGPKDSNSGGSEPDSTPVDDSSAAFAKMYRGVLALFVAATVAVFV